MNQSIKLIMENRIKYEDFEPEEIPKIKNGRNVDDASWEVFEINFVIELINQNDNFEYIHENFISKLYPIDVYEMGSYYKTAKKFINSKLERTNQNIYNFLEYEDKFWAYQDKIRGIE